MKNTESIPLQADSGSLDGPYQGNIGRHKKRKIPIGPF